MTGDAPSAHALVLAGGYDPSHPVAQADGVAAKAFARVAGVAMIERVVGSLLASGRIAQITLSLSERALNAADAPDLVRHIRDGRVALSAPAETRAESVLDGCRAVPPGQPLLIVTADHPLLTARMVEEMLNGAQRVQGDLAIGMTSVCALERRHPQVRCTSLRLRDGRYSGCNLYVLSSPDGSAAVEFWRRLERQRKAPHRIAAELGVVSLLGYLLRRWTLPQAFARVSARIGCRVKPVVLGDPEAAIDVDTVGDLHTVRRIVAQRQDGRAAQDTAATPPVA